MSNLECTKQCLKCSQTFPRSEFYKSAASKDGLRSYCKPCWKANSREYHDKNKTRLSIKSKEWEKANQERSCAYRKNWYLENREAELEKRKLWYQRNREDQLEKSKEYNRQNRDYLLVKQKEYRAVNKEKNKTTFREWYQKNKDKLRKNNAKRRALLEGAFGDGASLAELIRDHGPLCYLCREAPATVVEHVMPLCRGGSNYPGNLRPACAPCNWSKGKKTLEEYLS